MSVTGPCSLGWVQSRWLAVYNRSKENTRETARDGWVHVSMTCFLINGIAVLFSPALNYVWPYYHRHKSTLPPSVAARLEAGDPHVHTHEYGDALLKEDFAADSRKYEIDLEKVVDITCPVRIIHGLDDTEIDPKKSLQV